MRESAIETTEIRACLTRIVGSAAFHGSPNLVAFLVYVTETVLAGQGGTIKAYTVATRALGRSPDFDPQDDPIVRTEARRLRRALSTYYAGAGRDDPLRLILPLGQYVPQFVPQESSCAIPATRDGASAEARPPRESVPASAYLTFLAAFFLDGGAQALSGRVFAGRRLDLAA